MNLFRIFYTPHLKSRLITLSSTLLVLLLITACDDNNNNPIFVSEPRVTMAPNPDTPLAGILELETDVPTTVSVTIIENIVVNNAQRNVFAPMKIEFDELATDHALTLLGFTPGKTFSIEVKITDELGNQTVSDNPLFVNTDPLPEGFPPIDVTSNPEMMEPGVTIFPVRGRGVNTEFGGLLVAVNAVGDVVWYRRFEDVAYGDVRRMSNGNLLFVENNSTITEINMLGDVVRQWRSLLSDTIDADSILVNTDVFHHEVFEMPNGNLLTLGVEIRVVDNFPSSDTDPFAPTEFAFEAGDRVVEFTTNGSTVNEWSLLDMLDPFRIGYGSLLGFWNSSFPEIEQGTRDWSHGNAVIYDPFDDSIIVSLRHQDAVVKFTRESGELLWILGPHENWDTLLFGDFLLNPVGVDFLWQYHQHAPMLTAEGNIIIYDNGNFKATPFDTTLSAANNFSRAVEFSINEDTMEIEQVWEFGEFSDEILYAPFIGDADQLSSTGNVLITHGGTATDADGIPSDNIGAAKITPRILEVTRDIPAEVVFDLSIVDQTPETTNGWTVYRSERLPSLYP